MTVVGLGPAGPGLLTRDTTEAIAGTAVRFLRTTRHPAAEAVPGATSFDDHYERADTIEAVYAAIVDDLVAAASTHGHVLYAVPGSPAVAERTVEMLRADPRVEVDVVPALSCVDLAWVRLGVDPLAEGARIVDGHRFEVEAAGERGPLLVLQCDRPEVLAAVKLSADDGGPVTVLHHLGLPDERVET
ncbi:MAG TPA: SAM-dependent methyltransferase, partial [Acidimicrobiales bacterium]